MNNNQADEPADELPADTDLSNPLLQKLVSRMEQLHQPAADLTPEQVAQALNARKYLGRDSWQVMAGEDCLAGGVNLERDIDIEDARAIVAGWRAQDELSIQRENTDSDRAYIASLEASVASLTAENRDALELIANARELRHTVACWDAMHSPTRTDCACAMSRLSELYDRFGQLPELAQPPAPQPERPDLEACAAAVVRTVISDWEASHAKGGRALVFGVEWRRRLGQAIADAFRAERSPEQPDLDAIEARAKARLAKAEGEDQLEWQAGNDLAADVLDLCRRLRAGPADRLRNACAQALQALPRQHDESLIDVDEAIAAVMEAGR